MHEIRRFLVGAWIVAVPPIIFIIGFYGGVHAERVAAKVAAAQANK